MGQLIDEFQTDDAPRKLVKKTQTNLLLPEITYGPVAPSGR